MDEKERLKRRKEALLAARRRSTRMNDEPASAKELFCFRAYVTIVIVGLALALSFLPSTSTQKLSSNLKQAIAHKVSVESMQEAWQKTTAMIKGIEIKSKTQPVENGIPASTNGTPTPVNENASTVNENTTSSNEKINEDSKAKSSVPDSSDFSPDLPDDP